MWNKNNTTWNKDDNLISTDQFERFLERLKTYSKCINSAAYSVTNTLEDVYGTIKYQNAFWIQLTNLAPDSIVLEGIDFEKGQLYNLAELLPRDVIKNSEDIKELLEKDVAMLKGSNSLLFEDDGENYDFFQTYEPVVVNSTSGIAGGTSGTNSTSFIVDQNIVWMDGTNGVYGSNFEHLLINSDFTDDNWLEQFQSSDIENGYTQRNVFTSEKVFQKLLRNFHVIDIASTEYIDITQTFVSLDIDGTRVVPQHRILLKNQINTVENGVYRYEDNRLIQSEILNEEDETHYFSVFIKEGIENKNLEFFLDKKPDGSYPTLAEEKEFIEANNYVIRNRSSYRLLADHIFNSSDYFTQNEPLITTNFTNEISVVNNSTSGTNSTSFINEYKYQISKDFQVFEVYGDDEIIDSINSTDSSIFNPRLSNTNDEIYTLELSNSQSDLKKYGTNGLEQILTINETIRDYDLISDTEMYYITDDLSGTNFTMYNSEFSTAGLTSTTLIDTKGRDLIEVRVLQDGGDDFVFYNSNEEILLNFQSMNYLVKKAPGTKRLRAEIINNEIKLSWLFGEDSPDSFKIDIDQLRSSLVWNKDDDYELDFFSKTKIGDWEIIDNELYLKNEQITNLGTNFEVNVPRISTGAYRLYDGLDDYSELPTDSFDPILNSGGNYSMEFKTNPSNLRVNQPVFYFGGLSNLIQYRFRLFRFQFQLPPRSYMTFYVNGSNDFPYFQIAHFGKILRIQANKKLTLNEDTTVSFTYSYTSSKAVATLYFDGIPVGTLSDQRIETPTQTNIPLDIRNITYQKMFLGKSEFNTSPLYEGELSEIRLWNLTLNPSQVLSRFNKSISTSDILYPNLKAYWKLNDFNAVHEEEIFNFDGVFFGGLNLDPVLPEITSSQQIQLTDENLYLLDHDKSDQFSSGFGATELDIFTDAGNIPNVSTVDPTDFTNPVILLKNPTQQFAAHILEEVRENDIITGKIDTLYYASTSGGTPLGGLFYYNLRDSDGQFLKTAGSNGGDIQWFKETSTSPNNWRTLEFSYTVPNDLTYDGTNAVAYDDIFLQVGCWADGGAVDTYYDNFRVNIEREIPKGNIYKFILLNEKVENIYSTLNGISSMYLENENLYLLETKPNDLYLLNEVLNNTLIYQNNDTSGGAIVEFVVVENDPYMLRESNIIHDKNDNIIYSSDFIDFETIYAKKQTDINKFNLYWKQLDESVNILSDEFANTTSGLTLEYIASYPFIDNSTVELSYEVGAGTNSIIVIDTITIVNNRVLSNSVDLDENDLYWSINLQEVFGIYIRGNRLLVGTRTILNEIQVWMYDPITKTYIRFTDNNANATMFVTDTKVDLTYYVKNNEEFLSLIDPNTNKVLWFKIEFDNKFAIEYLPQEFNYTGDNTTKEIQYYNDAKSWMLLENGEQLYLSQFTNTTTDYNLWKRDIEFDKTTTGWITGEAGLLFVDQFTNPWELDFNNIIFKDNFNDVEVVKEFKQRDSGIKVEEWCGIGFMVGENGRIVRTLDNGTNFEVLTSGVYHNLNSVSFINERDGLIVGENNVILSTFSAGDSFIPVTLPEEIGFRNWKQVLYYKEDNAILIGSSGTIVHIVRNDQTWNVNKILNDLKLTQLDIQIKEENLDLKIDLNYIIEFDKDRYNGVINSIDYLGNDEFLICGDNDLICKLKLESKIGYKIPLFNFFRSQISANWKQVRSFTDKAINEKRAFLLSDNEIYTFEWDRFVLQDNTNIKEVNVDLFYKHDRELKHINFWDENYLLSVGERVNVLRHSLFTTEEKMLVLNDEDNSTSSTVFIDVYEYDLTLEEQDLKPFFKPRMLFTDYYIGRKINIHLEDGTYEKPTTRFEKDLLECFYFSPGESIEFTDYGTVDKQNNYLAYQDFYYMNRRVLDGGVDKFGKMESEYHKYNKKIEAVEKDSWRGLYSWEANVCEGIFVTDGTSGTNGLVCKDNLLENGDFAKGSLFWENDDIIGDDDWLFTSGKARAVKSEPFLSSQSHVLKQETLLFKDLEHKLEFEVTNTAGSFDMHVWGYKLSGDRDLLGTISNPSLNASLTFTPSEEYVAFGINVEYFGILNQTITLENILIDKVDSAFRIFNDVVTDPTTYTTGLFEESKITKIQLDPATFETVEGDVLDITVTELDKNKVIENGDTLFLRIKNPVYDVYVTAPVIDGQADFGVLEIDSIDTVDKTANTMTDEVQENALEFVNLSLKERCIKNLTATESTSGDIFNAEVGRVIVNTTAIVKENVTSSQTITIFELFDDAMVEEMKQGKLYLQNLNYFNGDLIHLEAIFNQHLLADSYTLNVREEDYIIIDGHVNDLTKYYNLESNLKLNVFNSTAGTSGTNVVMENYTYPVAYSEDVVYGANYNIMSFLQNLNSTAFDASYEFDLANHTFDYNALHRNGLGEFKEFFITKSQIYIGEDLIEVLDYKENTFIDVISSGDTVTRVHINKITTEPYTKYPDKLRYIIQTDMDLQNKLTLAGSITLRTRNRLDEISRDLEFTDDVMIPIPNQSSSGHSVEFYNRGYFKQVRTAEAYSKILMNDDNVRKHVTAVVYLDEENDWNLNVINWKDDPNFFYRPIEVHEVGVDLVLKKAISVDSANYFLEGETLELINVDFNKYNYKLIDLLTVKDLEANFSWVLNAEIRNAIIGQDADGNLVWYEGDWLCGIWENGTWYSGQAFDIEWVRGEVFAYSIKNNYNLIEVVETSDKNNTIWYNATWFNGTWNDGIWYNGNWATGTRFAGDWFNGTWEDGVWESGNWAGGTWKNGTWLEGNFSEDNAISIWENGSWLGGDFETGIWKNGTWDQTDRLPSRFGTKASLLHKAVWEYGLWKNGQFHSGLTTDELDNPIASTVYNNSSWKNGVWEKGDWYGGIWEMGRWNNGNWHNGLWQSNLDIDKLEYKERAEGDIKTIMKVTFDKPHYFKNVDNISNYFIVLGKPEIENGVLHPNTELLGYNMNPVRHSIIEVVDESAVLIEINDPLFPYPENATGVTSGTSGYEEILPLFMTEDIETNYNGVEDLLYVPHNNKVYVAHSTPGRVVAIDTENNVSVVADSTSGVTNLHYNNNTEELYVYSTSSKDVHIIDVNTDTVINTVTLNFSPNDILQTSTGDVYFSHSSGTLTRMNTGNHSLLTVLISAFTTLEGMAFRRGELFIACSSDNTVKVYNLGATTVTHHIAVGTDPKDIVYDIPNKHMYVTNTGDDTVTVIHAQTKSIIATLNIGSEINNIRLIDGKVYVTSVDNVTVIENAVIETTFNFGINPYDLVYYPEYDMMMVSNEDGDTVYAVDANTYEYVETVETGDMPGNIIYNSGNGSVYTVNRNSTTDTVTRIRPFDQDILDLQNCTGCDDYTLNIIEAIQFHDTPFEILQYEGDPQVASHWLNGTFNQGIWEFGWFNNGRWKGGIWIDGVFENGFFGTQ